MLTEKDKEIVLLALLTMANNHFRYWEYNQDDFDKETILKVLEVAKKIDSSSPYVQDIAELVIEIKKQAGN